MDLIDKNMNQRYMNGKYMTSDVKRLIDKFFDGETSLDEERWLYAFFAQTDIPEELEEYCEMFRDFSAVEFTEETAVEEKTELDTVVTVAPERTAMGKPPRRLPFLLRLSAGMAAAVLIIFGVSFFMRLDEKNRLAKMYDGSYMMVNGVRIDDLKVIQPEIKNALANAGEIERCLSAGEKIKNAEQNILNSIADEAERERIKMLLEE